MISFSHFSSSYLVAPSSHLSGPQIDSRFHQPSSCIRGVLMSEPRRFIFILVDGGVSCLNFTNPSPSHRFFLKVLYTGTCVCICTRMYFFATPQRLVIFFPNLVRRDVMGAAVYRQFIKFLVLVTNKNLNSHLHYRQLSF